MKNRPASTNRARQVPLDHLRPGGRHPSGPTGAETEAAGGTGPGPVDPSGPGKSTEGAPAAEPAEPVTPGRGDADAARGKATRSPARVGTRPHLEGSEQGPR
jgi:hypothetical protein